MNDERDAAARRDFQASVCPLADEVAPRQPLEAVIVEPGAGGHGGRALRSPGRRLRVAPIPSSFRPSRFAGLAGWIGDDTRVTAEFDASPRQSTEFFRMLRPADPVGEDPKARPE